MTFRKLLTVALAALGALAGIGVLFLLNPWKTFTVGEFAVRHNRLTDVVEMRVGERWTRFADDLYATPVPPEKVSRIRVEGISWGPDGILCAKAYNRLAEPLQGRVAIRIVFRNVKDLRFVRDRSLRVTVNFPPTVATPFVLATDLKSPDPTTTKTEIEFVPVSASGL